MRVDSDDLVQLQQFIDLPGGWTSSTQEYHGERRGGRDRGEHQVLVVSLLLLLQQLPVKIEANLVVSLDELPGSRVQSTVGDGEAKVSLRGCWNTLLDAGQLLEVILVMMLVMMFVVLLVIMVFMVISYSGGHSGSGCCCCSRILLLVGRQEV